ncbi:TPA: DUF2584 family protein [Bacillus pseudomycoides]|uniref:DUF2584 family protein n=1 Tax=Bacillus sp. 123MFChir2 TaxID=1169144 RepID=UPI000367FE77|nr:DUF2584 family protein [Bacillus sp. 123MFChir2]HDX9591397.1 DUF2584 family protein [Bacillus pseudomycoides]
MKFEMHTKIIVNETEKRLHTEDNIFQLTLEGYHLFVVDEIMPVYKTRQELVGSAVVKKVEWTEGRTTLLYQLISLQSVN